MENPEQQATGGLAEPAIKQYAVLAGGFEELDAGADIGSGMDDARVSGEGFIAAMIFSITAVLAGNGFIMSR